MEKQVITIDRDKCSGCLLCEKVCIRKAVTAAEFKIDMDNCFGCYHCISICPEQAVQIEGNAPVKLADAGISISDFDALVRARRSCRVYSGKTVDRNFLDETSSLLGYSPTGTNAQNVFLTIIHGRDKLRRLTDRMIGLFDRIQKVSFFLFPLLVIMLGMKNTLKFLKLKSSVKRYHDGEDILAFGAPVLMVFHTSAKLSSTPAEDCNIAATLAMLRLEIAGLGTCFNGYIARGLNFSRKIRTGLGIPAKHRVYTTLLAGYSGVKYRNLVERKPLKTAFTG